MSAWGALRKFFGERKAPAKDPASPHDLFAAEVQEALRATLRVTSIEYVPADFSLLFELGGKRTIFLGNVFAETREKSPKERRQRIERFVQALCTVPARKVDWEEARERLVPLLRGSNMVLHVGSDTDRLPIRRAFAPFLLEFVGLDSPDSLEYVSPSVLSGWAVQQDEVFGAAHRVAAEAFANDVEPFDADAPYGIWHVGRDDNYESSRLLVQGWLAAFEGKVMGRPVAIVPHRSCLIVGGDGNDRCLHRLVESALTEYKAAPRRISPALYTVDDGGAVIPLVLPRSHPLAREVTRGHRVLAATTYTEQQEALQIRLGEDIFVASCLDVKDKHGTEFTFTTWGHEVTSLLPRAERVAVDAGPSLVVTWDVLVEYAGDCLVLEPDLDPPRWRTVRWPSRAQIAKLRAFALPY
jgi:hypothetical protein